MGLIKTLANALRSLVGLSVKHAGKKPRRRKRVVQRRSSKHKVKPRQLKTAPRKKKPAAVRLRKSLAAKKKSRVTQRITAAKRKVPSARTAGKRPAGAVKNGVLPAKSGKLKRILVGEVTHYFDRASVAAFMVTGAPVLLGDRLEFEGSHGTLSQKVLSLQINRNPVKKAVMGDEVGLKVSGPVKEGDRVFKLL